MEFKARYEKQIATRNSRLIKILIPTCAAQTLPVNLILNVVTRECSSDRGIPPSEYCDVGFKSRSGEIAMTNCDEWGKGSGSRVTSATDQLASLQAITSTLTVRSSQAADLFPLEAKRCIRARFYSWSGKSPARNLELAE